MKLNRLVFAFLLIILFACDDQRVFESYADFDQKYWLADSTAQFQFNIDDTAQSYNLYLNIRNINTYPYHNLYIKYALKDSTGDNLMEDLVNHNLYNEKTGEPYGSGLGDIYSHQFILREDFTFPENGAYIVDLDQYMRQDTLKGIVSAGIRLELNKSNNE